MPRPTITSAQWSVRVNDEPETSVARAMVKTLCCGAVMYADIALPICPTCDRPISTITHEIERSLSHLKHTSTRYWS
jgi:hypothetical protein